MSNLGDYIRKGRERKSLLLRHVAQSLDMDTTLLSKIERSIRPLKEDKLQKMAEVLDLDPVELRTRWLADKVRTLIENEDNPIDVLKVAESQLPYNDHKPQI